MCPQMRSKQPAAALVRKRVLQRRSNKFSRWIGVRRAHAAALELSTEGANQSGDPLRIPAFEFILRHSLEPSLHDAADITRRLAGPGAFDMLFVATFKPRGPLH